MFSIIFFKEFRTLCKIQTNSEALEIFQSTLNNFTDPISFLEKYLDCGNRVANRGTLEIFQSSLISGLPSLAPTWDGGMPHRCCTIDNCCGRRFAHVPLIYIL